MSFNCHYQTVGDCYTTVSHSPDIVLCNQTLTRRRVWYTAHIRLFQLRLTTLQPQHLHHATISLTHTRYTTWVLEQVLHGQCSRLSLSGESLAARLDGTLSAGHASLNHPSTCAHYHLLVSLRLTSEPGIKYNYRHSTHKFANPAFLTADEMALMAVSSEFSSRVKLPVAPSILRCSFRTNRVSVIVSTSTSSGRGAANCAMATILQQQRPLC